MVRATGASVMATVLMSDASANQQSIRNIVINARLWIDCQTEVVIFSLLTGAVVAACIAPLQWSEIVMSRLLYSDLDQKMCC